MKFVDILTATSLSVTQGVTALVTNPCRGLEPFSLYYIVNPEERTSPLSIRNLDHSLAKVLALQHANEALASIVDTFRNSKLGLETALVQPLLQLLLVLLGVNGTKVLVADKEALYQDPLAHNLQQVPDTVRLGAVLDVVLRDLYTKSAIYQHDVVFLASSLKQAKPGET